MTVAAGLFNSSKYFQTKTDLMSGLWWPIFFELDLDMVGKGFAHPTLSNIDSTAQLVGGTINSTIQSINGLNTRPVGWANSLPTALKPRQHGAYA